MASAGWCSSIGRSACSPSWARRTWYPSSVRLTSTNRAMSTSSSTTISRSGRVPATSVRGAGLLDARPVGPADPTPPRPPARRRRTASAGSSARYTAVPATNASRPPRPPRRWCRRRSRRRPRCRSSSVAGDHVPRAVRTLSSSSGMNAWPPKPALIVMTSSVSKCGSRSRYGSTACPGRRQTGPRRRPPAGRRPAHRVRGGLGVERHVVRRRPPRTRRPPVGVVDHQVAVERQRWSPCAGCSTTGRPSVRLGTKWLSITSTCSQSAAPSTARRLVGEVREVGGQDARCDDRATRRPRRQCTAVGETPGRHRRSCRVTRRQEVRRRAPGTSRRCRAGAATAGPSGRRPRSRRCRASSGRASSSSTVAGARAARRSTTTAVSARCGEQVDVGDHAAGPDARAAPSASSSRCSAASGGQVRGLPPPARLRPPAQRAEPGARGVDEHPVEAAAAQSLAPSHRPSARRRVTGSPPRPTAHQVGAVRRDLDRGDAGAAAPRGRAPPSSAGLAAGAGAQVEPAARRGRPAGPRPGERDQLAALVLHAGPAVADDGAGSPGAPDRQRRPRSGDQRAGRAAGRLGQRRRGRQARPRRQVHRRAARCRRPAAPLARRARSPRAARRANARTIHTGCERRRAPAARSLAPSGASRPSQVGQVVLADRAQHGVGEAGRAAGRRRADEVDRGRRRRRAPARACAAAGRRPSRSASSTGGSTSRQRPVAAGRDDASSVPRARSAP